MEKHSTFLEVIEHYELTKEDCNKPLRDAHLVSISRSSCTSWKSLPAHLGLEAIVAEDADRSQADPEEKRLKFFRQWKKRKGSKATYSQLINALLKIDCRQDAEDVCQILSEPLTPSQTSSTTDTAGNGT